MTMYAASRLMWDVTRDKELASLLRTDPESALAGRDLTAPEHAALANADLRALFQLGTHPFVLYHFALRLAGGFSMPFMQHYLTQLQGLTTGDLET